MSVYLLVALNNFLCFIKLIAKTNKIIGRTILFNPVKKRNKAAGKNELKLVNNAGLG